MTQNTETLDGINTDREHDLNAVDLFCLQEGEWVDSRYLSGSAWRVTHSNLIPEKYTGKDTPEVEMILTFIDEQNIFADEYKDELSPEFEITAQTKRGNIVIEMNKAYQKEDQDQYVRETLASQKVVNSETDYPVEKVANAMMEFLKSFNRNILHENK